ncbi:MAG: exonuclease SbcCD subunit D [Clostridiales bacterium]|nr:exonuclease SbcCD subunit D [Clostridiales bacterium]
MRLLHTADLHIGKNLAGFSLIQDQEFALDRIMDVIESERPRVLLIAGDVYDKQSPSVEAVTLFDRFLTRAVKAGVIVMINAGNHDAPERLAFGGELLQGAGVFIAAEPMIAYVDDAEFHLLPYVKPALARRLYPEADITDYPGAVSAALTYLNDYLTAKDTKNTKKSAKRVLLAHQFFTSKGVSPVLSESETGFAGGLDAVDTGVISGYRYDYVALGHLHGPQSVGRGEIRYAGSPLKYSFSECPHVKSVTLVEIGSNNGPKIKTIPLPSLRDMRKIRGPLEALLSPEAAEPESSGDYLHVTLTDENEILDAMERLNAAYPNVMRLSYDNARSALADEMPEPPDENAKNISELFAEFFTACNSAPMSAAQESAVKRLLYEED